MRVLFLESDDRFIFGLPLGFRDAGHKIMVSGPIQQSNISLIRFFKPDLILLLGWTIEHTDEKLNFIKDQIKPLKIPIIYWATEDPTFLHRFSLPLINKTAVDYVFTVAPSTIPKYESMGIPASHLPFAYQPSLVTTSKYSNLYKKEIAVVANAYPNFLRNNKSHHRINSIKILIKPLVQNNMPIDFWGKYWDRMTNILDKAIPSTHIHGYLPYLQTYKVYYYSDIILGLQNYNSELVSMRTYEILGSGGFLITSYNEKLHELFKANHDLILSSSPEETLELVNYFKNHPSKRNKIKQHAVHAVRTHTYRHRAETIINTLKKKNIIP